MTNFCQACGGQKGLHFSTLPGCTCVNPIPINYVINQQIKREWQGLTDEEVFSILENLQTIHNRPPTEDSRIIFAKAVEQALKEKNT